MSLLDLNAIENPIVIYHARCMDGLAALWAVTQFIAGVEPHAGIYNEAPPDVTGRDVIIVDFSYSRDVLLDMRAKAKSLVVIDHHASAKEALGELDFAIFNMKESGASLTYIELSKANWRARNPNVEVPRHWLVPEIIQYVRDRDIWQFMLPFSKEISEYLRATIDVTLDIRTQLNVFNTEHLLFPVAMLSTAPQVMAGKLLLEQKSRQVKQIAKSAFPVNFELDGIDYTVPAAFGDGSIASDLGHLLADADNNPNKVAVIIGGCSPDGKFGLSFRGIGNDLAKRLAVSLGGGGHNEAAGAGVYRAQLVALIGNA